MALTKKTDKLDARGLAILLRNGTLPEVMMLENRQSRSFSNRGAPSQLRRPGSACALEWGRTYMGQVCGNVTRNLKWAFVETGNLIVINQRGLAGSHVVRLYRHIERAKNHQRAVVAVARHLAEAARMAYR